MSSCEYFHKLDHKKDLTIAEKLLQAYRYADFIISEYCVDESKWHISSEVAVEKIRKCLTDCDHKVDSLVNEEYKERYGWLSPRGKFYETGWSEHDNFAYNYICDNYGEEEASKHLRNLRDFLIDKGWALLHNPCKEEAFVTTGKTKNLTKAQKEFLFDYFIMRSRYNDANDLYKE
jgi:hypothetical protein